MPTPRISVIIPAYNVAAYVGATIQSVLGQTAAAHEILILDDGSTDDTPQILAAYSQYANVFVHYLNNGGQGPARNQGAAWATGDYIYFLDADDLLDSHFIARMQQLIQAHNDPDLLLFSGVSFTEDQELQHWVDKEEFRRRCHASGVSGLEAFDLLCAQGWVTPQPCLYLTRTAYWRAQGLVFPATYHQDEEVMVQLITGAASVVIRDEILFRRRYRQNSVTTQARSMSHLLGRKSNLQQAIADFAFIPAHYESSRKMLRRRCRNAAGRYISLCQELGCKPDRKLLYRAFLKAGSSRMLRRILTANSKACQQNSRHD